MRCKPTIIKLLSKTPATCKLSVSAPLIKGTVQSVSANTFAAAFIAIPGD
jgi:hypothetical protein